MVTRLVFWCAAAVALGATGCDLVTCTHPVADEATAHYDERLQGIWQLEPLPEPGAPLPPEGGPAQQLAIGKHPTKPKLQQWVGLEVKDDGEVVVQRIDAPTATLGEANYLSLRLNPDDKEAPAAWLLMRYHLADDQHVLLHLVERDAVSLAIRENKLAGVVKVIPPKAGAPPGKPREEIRITATTAELRKFLEGASALALFTAKPAFRMRRLK